MGDEGFFRQKGPDDYVWVTPDGVEHPESEAPKEAEHPLRRSKAHGSKVNVMPSNTAIEVFVASNFPDDDPAPPPTVAQLPLASAPPAPKPPEPGRRPFEFPKPTPGVLIATGATAVLAGAIGFATGTGGTAAPFTGAVATSTVTSEQVSVPGQTDFSLVGHNQYTFTSLTGNQCPGPYSGPHSSEGDYRYVAQGGSFLITPLPNGAPTRGTIQGDAINATDVYEAYTGSIADGTSWNLSYVQSIPGLNCHANFQVSVRLTSPLNRQPVLANGPPLANLINAGATSGGTGQQSGVPFLLLMGAGTVVTAGGLALAGGTKTADGSQVQTGPAIKLVNAGGGPLTTLYDSAGNPVTSLTQDSAFYIVVQYPRDSTATSVDVTIDSGGGTKTITLPWDGVSTGPVRSFRSEPITMHRGDPFTFFGFSGMGVANGATVTLTTPDPSGSGSMSTNFRCYEDADYRALGGIRDYFARAQSYYTNILTHQSTMPDGDLKTGLVQEATLKLKVINHGLMVTFPGTQMTDREKLIWGDIAVRNVLTQGPSVWEVPGDPWASFDRHFGERARDARNAYNFQVAVEVGTVLARLTGQLTVAGPLHTVITGTDVTGHRVGEWDQWSAGIGLVSGFALQGAQTLNAQPIRGTVSGSTGDSFYVPDFGSSAMPIEGTGFELGPIDLGAGSQGGTVAPAFALGRWAAARTQVQERIQWVNADVYGKKNCVSGAAATDSSLAGNPMGAFPDFAGKGLSGAKAFPFLEARFGGKFQVIQNKAQIDAIMEQAGPGARGIIVAKWKDSSSGHAWNTVNEDGFVFYPDGQKSGFFSNWDQLDQIWFIKTN